MLTIKTTMDRLRVGDRIHIRESDYPEEIVTNALYWDGNGANWVLETNQCQGGNRWYTTPSTEVEVLFSSDAEIADRIVEALAPFDPETLLEVRNRLCAKCGRVSCIRHN